jgi:hypothetical protein
VIDKCRESVAKVSLRPGGALLENFECQSFPQRDHGVGGGRVGYETVTVGEDAALERREREECLEQSTSGLRTEESIGAATRCPKSTLGRAMPARAIESCASPRPFSDHAQAQVAIEDKSSPARKWEPCRRYLGKVYVTGRGWILASWAIFVTPRESRGLKVKFENRAVFPLRRASPSCNH